MAGWRRGLLAACAALLLMPSAVRADAMAEARAALQRGDAASAVRLWRPLAEAGDAGAQAALGNAYFSGQGLEQDDEQAAAWYLKAATQGDPDAQTMLGGMYTNGRGVPHSYPEALRWYRAAAAAGHAEAQASLAHMYAHGYGVPQDPVRALAWLERAAAQGFEPGRIQRDALAAGLTAEQRAAAQRIADEPGGSAGEPR